jgi:hypothetical protein
MDPSRTGLSPPPMSGLTKSTHLSNHAIREEWSWMDPSKKRKVDNDIDNHDGPDLKRMKKN